MARTFEDLVNLGEAAVAAHARLAAPGADPATARQAWIDAAAVFQAAVTEHAEAEGKPRVEVEMAVKKAVRHPETPEG
ncbi:hypothetical protein [Streptomyces sp. NPDC086519]|uniref:hypothetical protein n=1 Tax=Streptomyces sp. NPDC086519 TaxID=3154863 RepID=UPI003425B72F